MATRQTLKARPAVRRPVTAPEGVSAARAKQLLDGLAALRDGNFRKRLPVPEQGIEAELATLFN